MRNIVVASLRYFRL